MWALGRLDEFYRAHHFFDPDAEALPVVSSRFMEGLAISIALVTPFWLLVGYSLQRLTR